VLACVVIAVALLTAPERRAVNAAQDAAVA